jgi:YfiH family protein
MMNKNFIIPQWSAPINIKAIQTTRNGGISLDRYSSLNLSNKVGDNQKHVEDNLKKILNFLPSQPIWLNQVHSNIVQKLPTKNNLDCDASFTYEKQIICAVRTADCLPILLTNKKGDFVASIHAGWKSLGGNIIENTIKEIKSSSQLIAWLGPCISQVSFEVNQDVYDYFISNDKKSSSAFLSIKNNKYLLSLSQVAINKLNKLGIYEITGMDITDEYCTYKQKNNFYSYRRDNLTGRMATLIWIE